MAPHPRASTNTDIKEREVGIGRRHEGYRELRMEEKGGQKEVRASVWGVGVQIKL